MPNWATPRDPPDRAETVLVSVEPVSAVSGSVSLVSTLPVAVVPSSVRVAESATPTGASFIAVNVIVFKPRTVVVVPSLADTLNVAAPLKFSVGVNVMPAKAVLASAMGAMN